MDTMKHFQKSTKTTHPTQTTLGVMTQPTQLVIKLLGFLKYLIIPGVIAACLFAFEFADNYSSEYTSAVADYRSTKKNLDKATADLLKLAPAGKEQDQYLAAKKEFSKAASSFLKIKRNESYLGFKSFQLFLGEFGKWIGILILSITFLIYHLQNKRKNLYITFIILTVLASSFYYLHWALSLFKSYSKLEVHLITSSAAVLVFLAAWFGSKYFDSLSLKMRKKNKKLATFIFKNVKPEKREEMLEVLKKTSI